MKSITVLLYGIEIPYTVIDAAIAECKNIKSSMQVIIVYPRKEEKPGYIFPSDLAMAETLTNEEDALEDDKNIIESNIQLIQQMSLADDVQITSHIRTSFSKEELKSLTATTQKLFVDAKIDKHLVEGNEYLSLSDIKALADCEVMVIEPA
jgi:Fic family protein